MLGLSGCCKNQHPIVKVGLIVFVVGKESENKHNKHVIMKFIYVCIHFIMFKTF